MKSIIKYLLESLINAKEINEYLHFEECDLKDVIKFLKTNDNYKRLTIQSKEDVSDFINNDSTHNKIMYKDTVVGYIGVTTTYNISHSNIFYLCQMYTNFINMEYKENLNMKKIAYVTYFIMDDETKKKIDINPFSLIKIFFEKFLKEIKNEGIKYIFAVGKDQRTSDLYRKLGNFERFTTDELEKIFKKYFDNSFGFKSNRQKDLYIEILDWAKNDKNGNAIDRFVFKKI